MELTKDDFYIVEDMGNSYLGIPLDDIKPDFDKEFEHKRDEILFNQKVVQDARIAIKECPLGLCAYCAGLRLALGDEPWK